MQSPLRLDDLTQYTQGVVRDSGVHSPRDVGWLASPKRWTFDSLTLLLSAVEQGLVYAWLPSHLIAVPIAQGRLLVLSVADHDQHAATLYLMKNQHKSLGKVATLFVDALTNS